MEIIFLLLKSIYILISWISWWNSHEVNQLRENLMECQYFKQCTVIYDSTVVGNFVRNGSRMSIFPEGGTSFCFIINGGLRFRDEWDFPRLSKICRTWGHLYVSIWPTPKWIESHVKKFIFWNLFKITCC